MYKLLTVMFFCLFLAACQTVTRSETKIQRIEISSELLDCQAKINSIKKPNPQTLRNIDVMNYITNLRKTLNECGLDNDTIKKIIKDYNEQVERFNQGE